MDDDVQASIEVFLSIGYASDSSFFLLYIFSTNLTTCLLRDNNEETRIEHCIVWKL
jgi:hypothetical protein